MHKKDKLHVLLLVSSLILVACSNRYDDDINKVIDIRNKELSQYNVKFNVKKVTKNNSCFKVYNDGEYIAMYIPLHSDEELTEYVYKKYGNKYEMYTDTQEDTMRNKKPDFTLNCKVDE